MRKIFKYLYGTGGGGGIPWLTSNSGANSSIMMTSLSPTKLPNYKTQAQASNVQTANTYTPKLSSTLIGSMIKNPSVNPTLAKPVTTKGITDVTPAGTTKDVASEVAATGPSKSAKVGNILSQVAGIASSIIPQTPQSGMTSALDTGFNAATGVVAMANPLAGGIMAGIGAVTDLARSFGLGTDLVTTEDQILDSKFLALTPLGLANSLGAKRGQTLNKGLDYDKIKADMGAGYGGIMDQLATSEKYAGKKMGNLFGQRDRANKKVYEGNYQLAKMEKIWDKKRINEAIQGTQSDMAFNKENLRMLGGWQDGAISFGRRGMIIEPARLRMIRHIVQSYKPLVYTETELSEEEIIQFKNGGSFNVIPEGSLHARLHHMENTEGLTLKGIPVVVEKDGGELELQAEIELNEIIFRLEVTNEIEKLMKDGSDNAAIECGKMLVKEIFENTQDRTGLIESLEEPKEKQEEVVKEHRVFQEGGVIPPELDQKQAGEEPVGYTEDEIPLYIKGDGSIGPLTEIGKDNLFDLIKNSNANWAKRLQDPKRKFIPLKEGGWGNFKLAWSEDETGIMVYPEILEINGKLVDLSENRDKAWESAVKNKDYIYFPSKEAAEWFTKNYKKYYRGFDKKQKK